MPSGQEAPESLESSATAGATQESQAGEGGLTSVRNVRTYQVQDESSPGGKIDVEREDLAKGYEYGRTAVHISETDENITNLTTYAAMELIGFIQNDRVCLLNVQYHIVRELIPISTTATCTCRPPISSLRNVLMTRPRWHFLPSSMHYLNWNAMLLLG